MLWFIEYETIVETNKRNIYLITIIIKIKFELLTSEQDIALNTNSELWIISKLKKNIYSAFYEVNNKK